jgi:serine/threonine-protein kinase
MPPSELVPDIDRALEAIIMKCLAKEPSERHASAAALADELRRVPAAKAWTDGMARGWWQRHAETHQAALAASSTPTLTITVNLESAA